MSTSVRFLVDGFNLYHSVREVRRTTGVECRWLDIHALCESMLHIIGGGAEIARIDYFSALAHHIEASRPGTVARIVLPPGLRFHRPWRLAALWTAGLRRLVPKPLHFPQQVPIAGMVECRHLWHGEYLT